MSVELESLSAIALLQHYRDRSLSPVEVTHATLKRIANYNPQVNAFVLVDEAQALKAAREPEVRWQQGQHLNVFHQTYDLLITPTVPITAFPVGQGSPQSALYPAGVNWTPFTFPFNLTQQPAASVPCGFTSSGLPIGLQIVAAKHRDALVLRAARAYETVQTFQLINELNSISVKTPVSIE